MTVYDSRSDLTILTALTTILYSYKQKGSFSESFCSTSIFRGEWPLDNTHVVLSNVWSNSRLPLKTLTGVPAGGASDASYSLQQSRTMGRTALTRSQTGKAVSHTTRRGPPRDRSVSANAAVAAAAAKSAGAKKQLTAGIEADTHGQRPPLAKWSRVKPRSTPAAQSITDLAAGASPRGTNTPPPPHEASQLKRCVPRRFPQLPPNTLSTPLASSCSAQT